MPVQATCPECKKALRVSDAARGKKIRCPGCQAVFPVGGDATTAKPRPARRTANDGDAPPPPTKRSWLPIIAVAAGVLFLLCAGGGSVVVYVVYSVFVAAADHTKHRAAEILNRATDKSTRPPDPVGFRERAATQIGWWGPDYLWLVQNDGGGAGLMSWEKQDRVLQASERPRERCRPYPGSPDGRLWYVTADADKQAVFKAVDLPADALKQAAQDPTQPLLLTPDGIVKK